MKKTLVVLAAGMGSRFGGMKQIEPVGPHGEFIIDYSIYDAIKAGFDKVVFIIRKANYDVFKETIGKRLDDKIEVDYAFQELDNLPIEKNIEREKPLGTGHALYCAKDKINGPFAIITSDDFYGPEAFADLGNYLDNNEGICIIGYKMADTIIGDEEVKRGVIKEENGKVVSVTECKVHKNNECVVCKPVNGAPSFEVPFDTPANMLMDGFNTDLFTKLDSMLIDFLNTADLSKDEFYLPDVIDSEIKTGKVSLVKTNATWMGMTYKEDQIKVEEKIREYIQKGVYKENLWEK